MEVFVGTSGWTYGWNRGRNLDWYQRNSLLNAVELNASFYRSPFKNQVSGWAGKGRGLHWCIKVHRFITHQHKFSDAAKETWLRFLELFRPLDHLTDWYLFQAPPSMAYSGRLIWFFTGLPRLEKCVPEIRDPGLLLDDPACRKLQEYLPVVSVDSPDTQNRIFPSDPDYLRMHGRDDWYRHNYTQEELVETAALVRDAGAEKAYIFFNNNHSMRKNAQRMRTIFGTGDAENGNPV